MSQTVVLLAPSLRAARQAAAQRVSTREETLVLGNAPGIARSWSNAFRDATYSRLPRFSILSEWFLEAATLAAAPNWSTRADRRFLLRAVLPYLRPQLKVLHRLGRSNDLVRQLDLLIADLRHAGHSSFAFAGDWSDDLQLIIAEYNRRLEEHGAVDIECAPALWAQSQSLFDSPDFACVIFDQILAPSPVAWRGMMRLCAQAESTLVSLALPWLDSSAQSWEEVLAQAENSALERILWLWRDAGAQLEIVAPDAIEIPKQQAVRGLLSYRQTEAPVNFDLTAAFSPRDEMERVASHLREQCAAPGDLEDAALILPDAATYAGVLEPTFAAHGVPVRTRRARPHSSYPLVARVLRLLQLHDSDWSVDEIADLFGDGLLRLYASDEENGILDIHRLRAACFDARLDSLRDEDECRERLSTKSEESVTLDPGLASDLACIAQLQATTARLNAATVAGEWRDEIFSIVECTLGHLWNIEQSTPAQEQARLQVEAFIGAVENVVSRFERWQLKFALRKKREPGAFPDFAFDCLRLELENATAPLGEKTGAALEVLSPLRIESDVPRTVYFAGLVEGAWPTSGAPGTLLARHQRELAPLRTHLPDPTHLARYQLALALVEADSVHLLYPLQSGGREVLRSPLLEDVALCWPEIPELSCTSFPTSRAAFLRASGAWARAGDLQLVESQFSSFLREAFEVASVDSSQLSTLLRIERERSNAQTLGVYDGALGENGTRLLHEIDRLSGRDGMPLQLSATRLKAYAQCPLRFFVRNVLKLQSPAARQEELRGDQSGKLVHDILEQFGRKCRFALTPENEGEAWFMLREITAYEIEKLPLRSLLREVEARRLLGNFPERPGGLLGKMLQAEITQQSGSEKKPAFAAPILPLVQSGASLPSTFKDGVELPLLLRLGDLRIDGRIDRIAVSSDGQTLAIIDYKTEWPDGLPKFADVNDGFDFQLALYLLAVRNQLQLWQESAETEVLNPRLVAAFFAMRRGAWMNGFGETGTLGRNQTQKGPGAICHANGREFDSATFHHLLDEIEKRIQHLGEFLKRAQFNISLQDPDTSGCKYCDYKTACRYDGATATERLNAANLSVRQGEENVYLPLPVLLEEKKASRSLPD